MYTYGFQYHSWVQIAMCISCHISPRYIFSIRKLITIAMASNNTCIQLITSIAILNEYEYHISNIFLSIASFGNAIVVEPWETITQIIGQSCA